MRTVTVAVQGIIDPALAGYDRRVEHLASCCAGALDGVEIGLFLQDLEPVACALQSDAARRTLAGLACNTVHFARRAGRGLERAELARAMAWANELFAAGLVRWVSFHLDLEPWFGAVEDLAAPGLPLLWENMDADAGSGATLDEAVAALAAHPRWDVVLDLAHAVETRDGGGAPPVRWAEALGGRVRQMHYSWPDNLYPERLMGPGFGTRHSFVHLLDEAPAEYAEVLRRLPEAVITLEGVVPPGDAGRAMLLREAAAVRDRA